MEEVVVQNRCVHIVDEQAPDVTLLGTHFDRTITLSMDLGWVVADLAAASAEGGWPTRLPGGFTSLP